jgi:hypothetical protein
MPWPPPDPSRSVGGRGDGWRDRRRFTIARSKSSQSALEAVERAGGVHDTANYARRLWRSVAAAAGRSGGVAWVALARSERLDGADGRKPASRQSERGVSRA